MNKIIFNCVERLHKTDGPPHEETAFSDSEIDDTHIKPPVVWRRRERTSDLSNKRTFLSRTSHITEPSVPVRLLNRLRVSNTEPAPV